MIEPSFENHLNLRQAESFLWCVEVAQPWGGLDQILDWCKQELVSDWRWHLVDVSSNQRPGRYMFYFDSERDCCAFTLKWVN